jgi:asparagine synthase (glutamine-hydrolysing)
MCGIAGFVTSADANVSGDVVRRMNDTIAHRGPDDEGYYEANTRDGRFRVALAHRRLSIIDLSTGHQPVGNEDGSVQIIFNGEIYNFQGLRDELIAHGHLFRTKSDTETIVHAYEQWGTDCLQRFRGMFAFALWDARAERLLLARDRFGKKPLFIAELPGVAAFASEIKALLVLPGLKVEADRAAIADYFTYRYVPAPRTLFSGIRKLMPGSYATWERGKLTEARYYLPPDGRRPRDVELPVDPVGAFLDKLDESVRIRMISDVPFGAFLSGGVDSSAVVGLMARHSNLPVKTFSVGFSESAYSELAYAKQIANQFRTDHHELTISQDHLMDELPALVRFRDGPVAEPSDIPIYLLSKEARKSVKMVLTGEGSDEILGGYPKHVWERFAGAYQWIPRALRTHLLEPLIGSLPYEYRRAKTAVVNLGLDDTLERMPRWFGALSRHEYQRLIALSAPTVSRDAPQFAVEEGNTALRTILYFDQTSWLPDNLLERGDRMTMAASLEGRMPFLDHELAAFVSTLPDTWRVQGRTTKRILREAMQRLLPASILNRPKVGFRVPVNEWFRGPMRDYLFDHLTGPASRTRGYYREDALQSVLNEHVRGRQNHEKLLWCLLNLEIWHRQYGIAG